MQLSTYERHTTGEWNLRNKMKLTKNFDAFDFEIIPMAGITISYRDIIELQRDEIFVAVTVLVLSLNRK